MGLRLFLPDGWTGKTERCSRAEAHTNGVRH